MRGGDGPQAGRQGDATEFPVSCSVFPRARSCPLPALAQTAQSFNTDSFVRMIGSNVSFPSTRGWILGLPRALAHDSQKSKMAPPPHLAHSHLEPRPHLGLPRHPLLVAALTATPWHPWPTPTHEIIGAPPWRMTPGNILWRQAGRPRAVILCRSS